MISAGDPANILSGRREISEPQLVIVGIHRNDLLSIVSNVVPHEQPFGLVMHD
jgi:hypothetical protein